jgi:hypothetical protein
MTILNQLRDLPGLVPLWERFGVPNPLVYGEPGDALTQLLRAVSIVVTAGIVIITNVETGATLYAAPLNALAAGVLRLEHLPSADPRPAPCSFFPLSR